MESARNKSAGKPLENNTRLYEYRTGDGCVTHYAVCFHSTNIVEIYPNGTYAIRTGGWQTSSTRQRIFQYAPIDWRRLFGRVDNSRTEGDTTWYLRLRPTAGDPEPPSRNHIEIEHPFVKPPDPGDEPQSAAYGTCVAGRVEEYEYQDDVWNIGADPAWLESTPYFTTKSDFTSGWDERRAYVSTITWGELSWRPYDAHDRGGTYKQCPHCNVFRSAHARWEAAQRKWDLWHSQVDTYGSFDAWRAAWRDDRQRVIAANRAWKEWDERNKMPLEGAVVLNGDGYPLQREVRAYRHRRYRERLRANKDRRAREERAKYERQLDRFRRGLARKRMQTQPFTTIARDTALTLAQVRERMSNPEQEA